MDRKNIFISYREKLQPSTEIALGLSEFFKEWGRKCDLIKYSIGNAPPLHKIVESIKSSNYLLQIFTSDTEMSEWMVRERVMFAQEHLGNLKLDESIIVLYTSDTDPNNGYYKEFKVMADNGHLRFIKIDDEEDAQIFLKSIIFDDNCHLESSGPICLPPCCKPRIFSPMPGAKRQSDTPSFIEIEDLFSSFRIARSKGLKSVKPDNRSVEDQILQKINQLQEGDMVSIIGFTLHRFTHPSRTIGAEFVKAVRNRNAKARLLLLNRSCRAADERMRIESPDDYASGKENAILYKDNVAVESFYREKDFFGGNVELKFYSTPYSGVMIFYDIIFVEVYHLGDDGESEADENTICGRVPVMVIENNSPFYRIFSSHFNQLWAGAVDAPDSCIE